MRNDVVASLTLMAVDQDCSPEITAMIGASVAISISDIPWKGPIGGVLLGYVDGQYVINPTEEQRAVSEMAVTVAASADKIVMIEAGANEIPDDVMYNGILEAHKEIKKIVEFIEGIKAEIGKPKFEYEAHTLPEGMLEDITAFAGAKIKEAMKTDDKDVRDAQVAAVTAEIEAEFAEKYPDSSAAIGEAVYKIEKSIVRDMIINNHERVDGRGLEDIRPLYAEAGVLPRVHGSGLFSRGQTQVLTIATLGSISEAQILDGVDNETSKRYMHHYNMPG